MYLLSYFPPEVVLRDGSFEALGLSNSAPGRPFLSFLDDARYAEELYANPEIACVICRPEAADTLAGHIQGIVLSDAPRTAYFTLHNRLAETEGYRPHSAKTSIAPDCQISPLAYIAPEGVTIGSGVVVEEFVSIHGPCSIGNGCVLHAGAKLGGTGFEFKLLEDCILDVVHCGALELGEDVMIWENATIHRAVYPWDKTVIGSHTRIGANSHIDHGAKIGAFCNVGAGAVISGRTEMGERAKIGPGTTLSNRLHVGDGANASLGSVVTLDVPAGRTVSGNFAVDHEKHLAFLKKIR